VAERDSEQSRCAVRMGKMRISFYVDPSRVEVIFPQNNRQSVKPLFSSSANPFQTLPEIYIRSLNDVFFGCNLLFKRLGDTGSARLESVVTVIKCNVYYC
jgi:hypothetical protein